MLKSGGTIDLGYIPPQDLPQKRAGAALPATNPVGDGYYLSPYYSWSFNYFVPNLNNPDLGPAFRQLYVRQALALTLNQPLGVEKAQRGYGYPNFGPVPVRPASRWLSPAAKQGTPYPFDPGRAKALLTGHGWTDQAGVMTCTRPGTAANQCGPEVQQGTRLSIKYDYASGTQSLDQEMQQYKSDAAKAGIELKLKQAPFNSVIGEAVPCKPSQAACGWQIANWGGGWIYAPDYLPTGEALFATGAGSNSGSYSDPTMDRLIKATQQQNGTGPLYTYEDYAAKQLPVIYQPNTYVINANSTHVGGVVFNPLATLNARVLVPHEVRGRDGFPASTDRAGGRRAAARLLDRVRPATPAARRRGPRHPRPEGDSRAAGALQRRERSRPARAAAVPDLARPSVHGDLGYSYRLNQSVSSLIAERLPKTIVLNLLALVFAVAIAIPIGVAQAVRRNGLFDYTATFVGFVFYSTPIFFLSLMLVLWFSLNLGWFPAQAPQGAHGRGDPQPSRPGSSSRSRRWCCSTWPCSAGTCARRRWTTWCRTTCGPRTRRAPVSGGCCTGTSCATL